MIAHSDIAYVIDPNGHTRYVLDTDPGPGTQASKSSFAGVLSANCKACSARERPCGLRGSRRLRRDRFVAALGVVALGAAGLAGCGAASGPSSSATTGEQLGIATSLATSIETSAGTWAVVPMGQLDQPLNTFWQLFFRAQRRDSLVRLRFGARGRHERWPSRGDSKRPGAGCRYPASESPRLLPTPRHGQQRSHLATRLPVGALAETYRRPCDRTRRRWGARRRERTEWHEVFASSGGVFSDWHELTTASQLGVLFSRPRLRRRLDYGRRLTPPGSPSSQATAGDPGTVGIYTEAQGRWQLVGPGAASCRSRAERVDVFGLQRTSGGLWAILAMTTANGTSLVAAWTGAVDMPWRVSAVFGLARSDRALSFGADGSTGLFVLTSASGSTRTLLVLSAATERHGTCCLLRLRTRPPSRSDLPAAWMLSRSTTPHSQTGVSLAGSSHWGKVQVDRWRFSSDPRADE